MELKYIKRENDNYNSIDDILNLEFSISSRLRLKLIKLKRIFLNSEFCNTKTLLKNDDVVNIDFNYEEESLNIVSKKMSLDIVYEDEWLLVINKPSGIAIHPSILHYKDSLSNGVKYYFDSIGLKKKIRPVNRLDKNTSGLVVFAKCEYIQECLIKQMETKDFIKKYYALVYGIFDKKQGIIDLPIARKENSIIERCISENGQRAITFYKVLEEYDEYSLVECTLQTGRTHQIRVHMKALGHPLLGDDLYGGPTNLCSTQALHCKHLEFIHPVYKKAIILDCKLPKNMNNISKKK